MDADPKKGASPRCDVTSIGSRDELKKGGVKTPEHGGLLPPVQMQYTQYVTVQ